MTAAVAEPMPGFLSRERTVAGATVQSVARAAGGVGHPPVHRYGLRVFRVLAAAVEGDRRHPIGRVSEGHEHRRAAFHDDVRLEHLDASGDVHAVLRRARHLGGHVGWMARARRSAQGRPRRGGVLVRGARHFRRRCDDPSAVADVARLGRHRRHRSRARLYLAGVDARQMVSRPARPGDRACHHGLRRWRDDRLASCGPAHEVLCHAGVGRRLANVPHARGRLLRVHDLRRARLSGAARRLEAGRVDAAARDGAQGRRDPSQRAPRRRVAHEAVLVVVERAVPQCDRGHRHHRHVVAAAAGGVRRGVSSASMSRSPISTRISSRRSPRWLPVSPGCSRCSTSRAASSGRRSRIASVARRRMRCSSCWVSRSIHRSRGQRRRRRSHCSWRSSA